VCSKSLYTLPTSLCRAYDLYERRSFLIVQTELLKSRFPIGNLANPMIAIVDDYKGLRDALERLLRSLGHVAATFASAEDFLKSAKLRATACLITDVQMPGLSGLDLQSRLTDQGHRIPIIFITGHPDDNVRARAMKAGAIAFLHKPVDAKQLIKCIEKAFQAA
jgi:FixJ family two-component response regulator